MYDKDETKFRRDKAGESFVKNISKLSRRHKMKLFLAAIVSLVLVWQAWPATAGPLHASCKLTWDWPTVNCDAVQRRIVKQMELWKTADNCKNGGEKCLYALLSQTADQIKGTHTTPTKNYVDDLSMKFKPTDKGCHVEGFSTSETWYAVLDYGTNYCNLNNLVTGASLDKETGFVETTSDSICTQYSSRNCDKY